MDNQVTDDIYKLIEQARHDLDKQLAAAMAARDALNENIKELRAAIDELPVRRTRRPRKDKTP